jgi:lipoprotein signal peptidase
VGPIRPYLAVLDRAAVAGVVVFVVAVTVDLGTKVYAVDHGGLGFVVYNNTHDGDSVRRALMSLAALAFTVFAAIVARRRGMGRLWGAWIGAGLLVGGVLSNGVSQVIWSRGTPDFIHFYSMSPDVWNIADFEIWWGLTGGIFSIAIAALIAFARERIPRRGAPVSES